MEKQRQSVNDWQSKFNKMEVESGIRVRNLEAENNTLIN